MKTTLIIIALFIGMGLQAQTFVYKIVFDKLETAETVIDSTMEFATVAAPILKWIPNGEDSTAVYEKGYFYDIISKVKLPRLNEYIVNPYPDKFNHAFAGINETNAIFVKP